MKRFALRAIGIILLALIAFTPVVHAAALPITVVQDDRAAVLAWDGGENANIPMPANVAGYRVVWGETTNPTANSALTAHRVFEAQPLTNGTPYIATITALDSTGASLDTLPPILFTGTTARVDALRGQMTGFFDDFNLPQGAPDERKWNLAFSGCNGPQSGFFINAQFHVHTMTAATNCDRGQTVVRPRATFDFTNTTGTIAVDFDGAFRRDQWYLDLTPQPMDITGQVAIEGGGVNNPGSTVRFHQNEQNLEILYVDTNGLENSLAKTGTGQYPALDWRGLGLVPNVRRHWLFSVSQTQATITLDGVVVLSTPLTLPFSKATVLFNTFSYNTEKSNEPYVVSHWDNFGMTGPVSSIETHNYRADAYDTTVRLGAHGVDYPVTIPDSSAGATAARLQYTLQMPVNQWYTWGIADSVTVNNRSFEMPVPIGAVSDPHVLVSTINPYSQQIAVPITLLKQGTNTVTFHCLACGVLGVHIEIDFPAGAAPTYTQPVVIMPPMNAPPPGAAITTINGKALNISGTADQNTAPQNVNGAFTVGVEATQDIAMIAVGKNPGIAGVEVRVDKQSARKIATHDTAHYTGTFTFNNPSDPSSLFLANGTHEFFFAAYDDQGRISTPDYFQAHSVPGDYYPVFVAVSGAPAFPTPTLASTTTAAPFVSPTAVPTQVATLTVAPSLPTPLPAHIGGIGDAGTNLAGACFASSFPATYGINYIYPTHTEIDYAVSNGESVVRLCFALENVMPSAGATFAPAELGRIDDFVQYATGKGLKVILDAHNFGRYFQKIIGDSVTGVPGSVLSDFWARLAARYKDNTRVIFELMNEPNSEASETWWAVAQDTTNAIRAAKAQNLILVSGNGWDGADSWTYTWYGTANGVLALKYTDPANNFAFEAHEYLDGAGGTLDTCTSTTAGSDGLKNFVDWLHANNKHGWVTEFGVGRNNTCYTALAGMLSYMDDNSDVLDGWTWWASGPWWGDWENGGYRYSIEPSAADGKDAPQMAYLQSHFPHSIPAIPPTVVPSPTTTPPSTVPAAHHGVVITYNGTTIYVEGINPQDVSVAGY